MATKDLYIRHLFGGGWATDFGPQADLSPDQGGDLVLPFLVDADNVVYELDGAPHKMPGAAKLNSSVLESGAVIKGLYDYWMIGGLGTPVQKRVCHVGTKIKADFANGTFTDIQTGMTSGAIPSYAVLEDLLVMVNGVDANQSFDGTAVAALTADPGILGMVETHKNRMFGAGNPTNGSRLFYSRTAPNGPSDWTGSGSGTIDVAPDDGDVITGIRSHKDELWIFKGPNKGSIHRLQGTSSSDFTLVPFVKGIGAVWNNLIFAFQDDLGFIWSDGTVHSLNATASFGDFFSASLSRPIDTFIREHANLLRLKHGWAVDWPDRGYVLICIPIDDGQNNTLTLMMDYRFGSTTSTQYVQSVRWAPWPAFSAVNGGCLALVVDSQAAGKRVIMGGGSDGYIRKLGRTNRSIDNATALGFKVTTPYLSYANPLIWKSLRHFAIGLQPKNNGSVTVNYQRDGNTQQSFTLTQGGGDVLGPATSSAFTLDSSTLGGARFLNRFYDAPDVNGEFRSIQWQIIDATLDEDIELHSLSAMIQPGAEGTEQ